MTLPPGDKTAPDALELSIVMPCLNEAETLATCIRKAQGFLSAHNVSGEVVIADNGSTDGSRDIAADLGARVVEVPTRGYGAALQAGIAAARGRFVVMGDADDSYDFSALMPFLTELRAGNDLVMGDRFAGGIAPGAMPFLHRYLGNPVLSFLGRLFFGLTCRDFHCGLRGFAREAVLGLHLQTTGMEFASEMLVRAGLAKLRIVSVPTRLAKDGRSRPPHLRTWRDGWRHLRFLLLFSPRWLFLYPGFALIGFGLAATLLLLPGKVTVAPGISLDVHTLLIACMSILVGTQSITFGMLARRYAARRGLLPDSLQYGRLLRSLTLEHLLQLGGALVLIGGGGVFWAFSIWRSAAFGPLNYPDVMRILIPSVTVIASGVQLALAAFLASVMEIDSKS
ncbi:MAG TPA: glycosyltransferase family 2 protein [Parvibaculum sp.]